MLHVPIESGTLPQYSIMEAKITGALSKKCATLNMHLQLRIDYRRFMRLVYAGFQDLLPTIPVSANVGARDEPHPAAMPHASPMLPGAVDWCIRAWPRGLLD